MAIGIDMAFEESSYPVDFKKDAQGRLTDVTITMPESGLTDYPIISVKYYGDGLLDSITDVLAWAGAAALLRFVFAASAMLRARQAYTLAPEASCKPNPRRKQLRNSRTL